MHNGGFIKVFIIIAAITLLMDWYVYHGLRTLTLDWSNKRIQNAVLWGYLVISVGITVLFMGGLGSFTTAQGMRPFHEYTLSLFITFFVTKLVFILVLFLGDIGRFFVGIFNHIGTDKHTGNATSRRAVNLLASWRY
jgi:hypothetical protein